MSARNREGYTFSDTTKKEVYLFQKNYCGEKKKQNNLECHHKIPIHFAKEYLQDSQEVKEYIAGRGNAIYLDHETHQIADKQTNSPENIELMLDVIREAIGNEAIKTKEQKQEYERQLELDKISEKPKKNKDKKNRKKLNNFYDFYEEKKEKIRTIN